MEGETVVKDGFIKEEDTLLTILKTREIVVEDGFINEEDTHFTVLKTSLFSTGDGFTVYDSKGELVYRVDSYGPDTRDKGEVVLMDGSGRCLLTVRRKRPSLHQRWEGFLGEGMEGEKAVFNVRRSSMIGRSCSDMTVEVYNDAGEEYQMEGSFGQRSCTIFNAAKESVAEIRRKVDVSVHMLLGKDVFTLCIKPGFDGALAMGLVLVLDQINGDDSADDGGAEAEAEADPTSEVDPTSVESP